MLQQYWKSFKYQEYLRILEAQNKRLIQIPTWDRYRQLKSEINHTFEKNYNLDSANVVRIGEENDLLKEESILLGQIIESLIPWRKGPYQLFEHYIDSEWLGFMKWNKLEKMLGSMSGQRIADIGCNNGYEMFRLLSQNPEIVIGFDPSARCHLQFDLINSFVKAANLYHEPLGIEHLDIFDGFFDTIFCMGVIYHRRDPFTSLMNIRQALKKEGKLIFETMTVPGEGNFSFSPPDRYCKMRNVWFVPSRECVHSWLTKAGFGDVEHIESYYVGEEEQRRTAHSPDESLNDFLDPTSKNLTVEGYPAPLRSLFVASK